MKPNSTTLKAFFLLLIIVGVIVGVYYFSASFPTPTKFSVNFGDYPPPSERLPDDFSQFIDLSGFIYSFDATSDGKQIAVATSTDLIVYDLQTLNILHSQPLSLRDAQIAFSPQGDQLALSGFSQPKDDAKIHVFILDTSSWKTVYAYDAKAYKGENALAWSLGGKKIAFPDAGGLSVADVATGDIVNRLNGFDVSSFGVSWSPDGKRIAAVDDANDSIRRWNLSRNQWVRLWDPQMLTASEIRWSPDGGKIASGHYGGAICIWNSRNNACEGKIQAHHGWIGSLGWSPDGKELASAASAIRIWDASNGELKSAFGFHEGINYRELEWANANTLITLENQYLNYAPTPIIRVWDISLKKETLAFRGWVMNESADNTGLNFTLENVQTVKDKTLITVSLNFDSPDLALANDWTLRAFATDESKEYELTDVTPPDMDSKIRRVYQTENLAKGAEFNFIVASSNGEELILVQDFSKNPPSFGFDLSALKVGGTKKAEWEISPIVYGWRIYLLDVRKPNDRELIFTFSQDAFFVGAELSNSAITKRSQTLNDDGTFSVSLTFAEATKDRIELSIEKLYFRTSPPFIYFRVAP
ncbi:MAG: hypothetical protein LC099_07775 [Anaerolineales bacterium]|nr:hypothetical protein [Anaerolineales bacterium]